MTESTNTRHAAVPVGPQITERSLRVREVWLVLGLSLLRPAAFSVLDLVRRRATPIKGSRVVLAAPPPRIEDLISDVLRLGFQIVPVLLVGYLLASNRESWATLRLDRTRPKRDLGEGVVIAAVVGVIGLVFYVFATRIGITRTIIPVSRSGGPWWTTPVLFLNSFESAIVEEVIVAAYLLHRLRQLGWKDGRAIGLSAVVRGSYHLYQGYGAFLGNAVMGVAFGEWLRRGKRVWPLVTAHFLIDAVAFVGWFWFRDRLDWLPR